jgi:hypothetical protein
MSAETTRLTPTFGQRCWKPTLECVSRFFRPQRVAAFDGMHRDHTRGASGGFIECDRGDAFGGR